MEYADQTNLTPSFDAYTLSASVTFDKTTATANKDLYITGLPASWTPPTEGDWAVSGTHEWNGNYNDKDCVRLGQNTGSNPQYIYCNLFAIPAGVKIEAPYDVMTQGATVATTLSLSLGNDTYFSQKSRTGTEFTPKRDYYEGTATFTLPTPHKPRPTTVMDWHKPVHASIHSHTTTANEKVSPSFTRCPLPLLRLLAG